MSSGINLAPKTLIDKQLPIIKFMKTILNFLFDDQFRGYEIESQNASQIFRNKELTRKMAEEMELSNSNNSITSKIELNGETYTITRLN